MHHLRPGQRARIREDFRVGAIMYRAAGQLVTIESINAVDYHYAGGYALSVDDDGEKHSLSLAAYEPLVGDLFDSTPQAGAEDCDR